MTYDDLLGTIAGSSRRDWVCDEDRRRWTYKGDLTIRFENSELLGERNTTRQEWVRALCGRAAEATRFTIYYGSSFVEDAHMVAADDDRTFIPFPAGPHDPTVAPWQYRPATIIAEGPDAVRRLDDWLQRIGIVVRDAPGLRRGAAAG